MSQSLPVWRSMLFLPAHVEKFVAKAHTRGADACILDLEDSVPLSQKAEARAMVAAGAQTIAAHNIGVLVRVNNDENNLIADLDAVVNPSVAAIVLPKVNDAAIVALVAERLDALEAKLGMRVGHTYIIAQIEDVRALPNLDEIAVSSSRLLGMSLGSEDFSASACMAPIPETLFAPNQMVAFACRRAGILPFGFPASIADYSDAQAFARTVKLASQLGFVGAFCIHPSQAHMLNEGFSPSSEELEHATGLLAAFAEAEREGRGAFAYKGKMVDPPVVARAEELLRRADAIAARNS
ncbi:HpcH/HpaI aldolase/citrate lyase family protein [Zhongshania aliphaticivorans]|uniref:HpcH/HpaI aldolase/citrate lyase family protein n=1 Tax=Zhongshania aliphaticivorans TaxID=1470434 RepID=UPI0012E52D5C|nr:CoA ester lyase [Zhongshania aliphaticivorans]CAA0101183.1 Citrate lyase subunit beta [Zhongshania aliphaticivorans]